MGQKKSFKKTSAIHICQKYPPGEIDIIAGIIDFKKPYSQRNNLISQNLDWLSVYTNWKLVKNYGQFLRFVKPVTAMEIKMPKQNKIACKYWPWWLGGLFLPN